MITLTFEALEAEVRRLAAESPDFVYPRASTCLYNAAVVDGEMIPACIFGQAFTNLGRPVAHEGVGILVVIDDLVHRNVMADPTEAQTRWAYRVQVSQDTCQPWGVAVSEADGDIARWP